MVHGNTDVLARRQAAQEEEIKYERNLEAWRERHEVLQDRKIWMDTPVTGEQRRVPNQAARSIVRNTQKAVHRLSQTVCQSALVGLRSLLTSLP